MYCENYGCGDCPYGAEEYARKNSPCGGETYADSMQYDTGNTDIYCDKTGGKVSIWGYCEDATLDVPRHKARYNKRHNKHDRDIAYKNHLKQLAQSTAYPQPVIYVDDTYTRQNDSVETVKPYYKRLYRGRRSKYLKKQSNRVIRRYVGEIPKGNQCHRLYDFWWEYI